MIDLIIGTVIEEEVVKDSTRVGILKLRKGIMIYSFTTHLARIVCSIQVFNKLFCQMGAVMVCFVYNMFHSWVFC